MGEKGLAIQQRRTSQARIDVLPEKNSSQFSLLKLDAMDSSAPGQGSKIRAARNRAHKSRQPSPCTAANESTPGPAERKDRPDESSTSLPFLPARSEAFPTTS